jgi:hypothetical protein
VPNQERQNSINQPENFPLEISIRDRIMNGLYTSYVHRRQNHSTSITAATVRALLLRSTGSYAFNPDHDFVSDIFSNGGVEITVASYARQTLAGKAVNLDDANDRTVFDFDNIAFGNLEVGQTVSGIVFYEFITNDAASPLIYHIDGKIKVVVAAPAAASSLGSITNATQANPVVITSTAHGLLAGEKVHITGVGGMTQINNLTFTVANPAANTFELSGINGTGYGAYTSGGTWNLVRPVYVEPLKEAINDGTAITINGDAGTVDGAHSKGARVLNIRSLAGAVVEGEFASNVQTSLNLPVALGGGSFNVNVNASGFLALLGSAA